MRKQLEDLWAELGAIIVWDRYYCLEQTHDEIDGVAWAARRQRLAEIQKELEELRQALPASVPGLFATTGPPRLSLITCGGSWDKAKQSFTLRVIVDAHLVGNA